MNKIIGSIEWYRSLLGTFALFIIIAMGCALLTWERFSALWFLGAINISLAFFMCVYINTKFIIYHDKELKEEKAVNYKLNRETTSANN
jgi:low temperature requirement protein LtrA